MKIEKYLYEHFGKVKPTGFFEATPTFKKIHAALEGAVEDAQWLAIYGPIMSGKTTAVDFALSRIQSGSRERCRFVNLYWPERTGINISEILNQIIYTTGLEFIGTASPKRGKEMRMLQVLDILTAAKVKGNHIVLLIDEAHELHLATLKALKRLWEYKFKGQSDLISIILTGQPSLEKKIQSDAEIRKRVIQMPFEYAQGSRAHIAKFIGSGLINNEIASALSSRFEQVGDIVHAIREAMLTAEMLGTDALDVTYFPWPTERKESRRRGEKLSVDASALEDLAGRFGVRKDGTNG